MEVEELVKQQTYEATVDGDYATRTFVVEGARGPTEAYGATGAVSGITVPVFNDLYEDPNITPAGTYTMRAKRISIVNLENRDDLHQVTVKYDAIFSSTDRPSNPVDGDEIYEYQSAGETVNVKTAILGTAIYGADAISYSRKIGCSLDGEVQGVDVPDSSEILTVTQWKDTSNVTQSYINAIRAVRNKVCSVSWYGAAVGEVLFVGMRQISKNEFITELEFTFKISKNKLDTELPIYYNKDDTPYSVTAGKQGWKYLWEQSAETTDNATKVTKQYTRGVYVETIFETDSFSALGLANVV